MSEWNEFAARDEARANAEQDELDQLRAALAAANARAEEAEAKIARYEALETTCRSKHRHATIHDAYMCDLATARAEAAEAQLELVDEYGRYCHDSAQPGDEQLPWPYTSFADWRAKQGEARP